MMETASHPIGPERQLLDAGAGWLQLATYPQSPFSGPVSLLRRNGPVPGILAAHQARGDYG